MPPFAIELPFHPNLVGSISWHGIFSAIGVLLVIGITIFGTRRLISFDSAYVVALLATLGGLLGSRAVHFFDNLHLYDSAFDFFRVWEGGIGLWGTLIGAPIVTLLGVRYLMRKDWTTTGKVLDILAIAAPVGIVVGRIGDIINGEHCSTATNLPWGVIYTNPANLGYACITQSNLSQGTFVGADPLTTAVHSAVAYEMLWFSLGFLVLLFFRGRLSAPGSLMAIALLWYAVGRFAIQFLRLDQFYVGILQEAHFIAIGVAIVSAAVLIFLRPKWDKSVNKPLYAGFVFPTAWSEIKDSFSSSKKSLKKTTRKPKKNGKNRY